LPFNFTRGTKSVSRKTLQQKPLDVRGASL